MVHRTVIGTLVAVVTLAMIYAFVSMFLDVDAKAVVVVCAISALFLIGNKIARR